MIMLVKENNTKGYTISNNGKFFIVNDFLSEIIYDRLFSNKYSRWNLLYDIYYYTGKNARKAYTLIRNRYKKKITKNKNNINLFHYYVKEYSYEVNIQLPYGPIIRLVSRNKNKSPVPYNVTMYYINVDGKQRKLTHNNFINKKMYNRILRCVCDNIKNMEYTEVVYKIAHTANYRLPYCKETDIDV